MSTGVEYQLPRAHGQRLPSRWLKTFLQGAIRAYQVTLSPYLGRQCRFYPTCSHYAHEAIEIHGARKGMLMAARRLSKCHPFHAGGVDLVPTIEEP